MAEIKLDLPKTMLAATVTEVRAEAYISEGEKKIKDQLIVPYSSKSRTPSVKSLPLIP